jgi:hypothetical protein
VRRIAVVVGIAVVPGDPDERAEEGGSTSGRSAATRASTTPRARIFADAGGCGLRDVPDEIAALLLAEGEALRAPAPRTCSDVSVFDVVRQVKHGSFAGGGNEVFTAQNGGIGVGRISPKVPASLVARERAVEKRMAAGKIPSIPTKPSS